MALTLLALAGSAARGAARVVLLTSGRLDAPAEYGLEKLRESLRANGLSVERATDDAIGEADFVVLAGPASDSRIARTLAAIRAPLPQGPQALVIRRTKLEGKPALILCGSDARGLMYAALETADRVSWSSKPRDPFTEVRDASETPYLLERGISMYTMHRAYFESRLYDDNHWKRYFDLLARSRINAFTVIFGYENGGFMAPPYPYFFDVAAHPEVRLAGITPEQQQRNIAAFRSMIRIAHERGIDIIAAIWDHIYRGGVQSGGIPGASDLAGKEVPGLVAGLTAENLAAYTKAALARFLEVFPEVDGLEFRMHPESGLKRGEMAGFWHEVFTMLSRFKPGLRVTLRAKELPDAIIEDALNQGLNARIETKYWMEQMGMPFHPTHINPQNQRDRRHGYADLLRYPQRYRVHWRLWSGGTTRLLLWADPDYVRRFAASARLYQGNSMDVNEMLATRMLGEPHDKPPSPILNANYRYYDYEFERYWHFYQVWGRVSYNPQTPPEVWEREFQRRFGPAGGNLMKALHTASKVLPRIVASSYRYQLFPTTRGWAEMMRQEDLPAYADLKGSDIEQFMNPRDAAKSILSGTDTAMIRPEENSRWFARLASEILQLIHAAEKSGITRGNNEALSTVTDLRILAHLAQFHSARLLAAVSYNLYRQSGDLFALDEAIRQERNAVSAWQKIVDAAADVYYPDLPFGVHRTGFSRHWKEELGKLRAGLEKLEIERRDAKFTARGDAGLSIAHVPVRKAEPGGRLSIEATIASTAPIQGVAVHFSERTYSMREIAPGMYRAEVPAAGGPQASYYIEAVDTSGNRSLFPAGGPAAPVVVRIDSDRQPPSIELWPTPEAHPGQDLPVEVRAEDASGLKSVRLRYRHLTQFEDYVAAEMKADSVAGRYTAVIPGAFITPEWDLMYFVEAIDNAGNGRIFPDLELRDPYVIVPVKRSSQRSGRAESKIPADKTATLVAEE